MDNNINLKACSIDSWPFVLIRCVIMSLHKSELYYCEICGAEIEVKRGGDGTLKCCGQAMKIKQP